MNSENIGIKIEEQRRRYKTRGKGLRIWLFWKNVDYPFSFIGVGVNTITRSLGITKEEAEKLLIGKLEEVLPTLEDEQLKIAVKERINFLRHEPIKWKTELRVCRLEGCGNKFYPKKRNQVFCKYECMKKAYRKPKRREDDPARALTAV